METALDVLQVVLTAAALVVLGLRRKRDAAALEVRGREIGRIAVRHAEQLGGSPAERLRHALDAFRLIDVQEDGKRDFSEAQARIYVEAAVAELTNAKP